MSAPGGSGGSSANLAAKKEAAKALLKSAWLKTRSVATNKSKIELLVEDATSLEAWGPTGNQMNEIADACFDAEKFRQAWGVILRRFEAEPDQWRRIYKALLLTEHLLKNSSQHVVQTILEAQGVLEGLKQFKYEDEKRKNHGINVSNRAKELVILLENPDRIRAERAKAKSLKEKFKGASREEMAAAGGSAFGSSSGSGWAGSGNSTGASSASGWGASNGGSSAAPQPGYPPRGAAAQRPVDDGGHVGEEGPPLAGEARPSKGYGALSSAAADPVSATAQRINSLRQAGMLKDDEGGSSACNGNNSGSGAAAPRPLRRRSSEPALAGMSGSRTNDADPAVASSGGSQTSAKPSLHELAARRAGPKKLQEVRVNPAIASAMFALGGATAKPTLAPPPAHKPAAAATLPPPPAPATDGTAAALAKSASSPTAALVSDLVAAAPEGRLVGSGGSSPWSAGSGMPSAHAPATFNPFSQSATGGQQHSFDPFQAAPAIPAGDSAAFDAFAKPGTPASGMISLTATAGASAGSTSPTALPAYLFAEPSPPAYSSAAAWGSHVGGAVPQHAQHGQHHVGQHAMAGPKQAASPVPAAPVNELFSDFSPFK